jgi:DNA mismatch repair protein MutS2
MEPTEGPILPDPCPDKTRSDLEWDRLLQALADRAMSEPGKRICRAMPFAPTHEAVLTALGEVKEASELDRLGEPLPSPDVADVSHGLDRARIGATLSNEELRALGRTLAEAGRLRRFLATRKARTPLLFRACSTDPGLDALERELNGAFDPDGTLADRASPRLGDLRAERRNLRDRLVRRLEEVMRKHADILQDTFYTERDGRYVLPVRADAHERFPGIVHATSGSGATLFVEPRIVVEMGNRLKMVEALVTHEEELVYAALSMKIGAEIDAVDAAAAALAHADVRAASARLAKDLRFTFPDVPAATGWGDGGGEPSIRLVGARHPLLALDGVAVVPSDIAVRAGHAMIVSGPNAGGKTVALKTLGLAALCVRAGLPVPADEGSEVAVFEVVLTDVGDDQNLHKNLSTFSAHVKNLALILADTRPGALVLLDELAGGTDPREGEALASAVLDSLAARGGAVATTTHYEGLKALALADPRFSNASVGFDMATMSPTFKLSMGIPGASSALAVARRFGIPGTVLERAERFLSRDAVRFEDMVEKLQAERRALELARESAERELESTRTKQRALDVELTRLRAEERTLVTEAGKDLMESIRRARQDLRDAQARLRAKPTVDELRAASRAIDAVAQKTSTLGELEPAARDEGLVRGMLAPGEIRVGTRVYVPRLRAEADVVEILAGDKLRVAAGPLKLTTTMAEVRAVEAGGSSDRTRAGKTGGKRVDFDAAADPDVPIQTSDNTVDLRGLRAHEAVGMAEQFLDRAVGAGRRVAFLIHGHGKGALRDAVRDAMKHSPYVSRLRPGEQREGGDGVTVVWLRA